MSSAAERDLAMASLPDHDAGFVYEGASVVHILQTSLDAVFTIDDRGTIVDLNPAAVSMFGWSREELLGANISIIVPSPIKESHDGFLDAFNPERGVKHVLGSGQRLNGQRKDGRLVPVEVGISSFLQDGKRYFTGFVRDMSERQRSEEQMRFLATHDTYSGLLNLRGFLHEPSLPESVGARVIVFRLEEFRHFGLIYGESWITSVVHELARRLHDYLSPGEIAARIGMDLYAILSPDAAGRAEALAKILAKPFSHGMMRLPLTATIAVSFYKGTLEERLRSALWACERAGDFGKGRIHEFTDGMARSAQREQRLENRLRQVVREGAFSLALQPKVRLADRRIAAAEALVRWIDPKLGLVSNSEFIPMAERLGLVSGITDWMLRQSLVQVSRWPDPSMTVAVNFSALDFFQPNLIERIRTALLDAGAEPRRLVIELTESIVAHDTEFVNSRMREIKALGVAISLDDFGTGYSSLTYLRQFPIDSLKIDISFVRDLPDKPDAVAIASAIVAMAQALGLETIAEGIEDARQAELLRGLGVDLGQGFFFSEPVTSDSFRQLLRAQG